MVELGEVAYRAYYEATDGRTFDNRPMPKWGELPPHVVHAWKQVGKIVALEVYGACKDAEPPPETLPAPPGYPHASANPKRAKR